MLSNEEQKTLKSYNKYRTGIIPELIEKSLSTIEELKKELYHMEGFEQMFRTLAVECDELKEEVERLEMEVISRPCTEEYNGTYKENETLRQEVERYRTALERVAKFGGVEYSESYFRMQEIAKKAIGDSHELT